MDGISIIAITVFLLGYIAIAGEHFAKISKSAVALFMGAFLWILASFSLDPHQLSEKLTHTGSEVFGITVFLLAAMALVEVLVHYGLFDWVRYQLNKRNLSNKKQFFVLTCITFILSSFLDNLTVTIIMIQIARRFFTGKSLLVAAIGIVVASNAGGAFSPIGDITTMMMWFAGKFSPFEILTQAFLPSVTLFLLTGTLLLKHIEPKKDDSDEEVVRPEFTQSHYVIFVLVMIAFLLPMFAQEFALPAYILRMLGLGVVWFAIDVFKRSKRSHTSHLDASIEHFLQKSDLGSLKFFIGILLAVSALESFGVLEMFAHLIYGANPTLMNYIIGNSVLGLVSAVLDNVPLAAIAIEMLTTTSVPIWTLLAITVGTGGSLLVVGSASGVVAMGMIKELSFGKYFKLGFFPILIGMAAAIAVWCLQYILFLS